MLAFTGALVQSYGMHFDGKMNGMFYEKGVNPFEVSFQCLSSRAAPLVSRSGQHHSVAPTPSTRPDNWTPRVNSDAAN